MTKRKASVHGNGVGAIMPELQTLPSTRKFACVQCQEKEDFILRQTDQIKRLQKVVRDQEQHIHDKQRYIDLYKVTVRETVANLKQEHDASVYETASTERSRTRLNDQLTILTAALLQGQSIGLSQDMIEKYVDLAQQVAREINKRFKEPTL